MAKRAVVVDRGWRKIKRDCAALDRQAVKVGLRAGGPSNDGVPIVAYATWNEFGTNDGHVPSRPFMRRTSDEVKPEINSRRGFVANLLKRMISGHMTGNQILDALGLWYQAKIRATIRKSASWAKPNAPATIKAKKSSTPLIDDAMMIGNVDYQKTRL